MARVMPQNFCLWITHPRDSRVLLGGGPDVLGSPKPHRLAHRISSGRSALASSWLPSPRQEGIAGPASPHPMELAPSLSPSFPPSLAPSSGPHLAGRHSGYVLLMGRCLAHQSPSVPVSFSLWGWRAGDKEGNRGA